MSSATASLCCSLLTNPHTSGGRWVEELRSRLLGFLGARDHDLVFTSSATGALRLIAGSLEWGEGSVFAPARRNHTSVLGIRSEACSRGGAQYRPLSEADLAAGAAVGGSEGRTRLLAIPGMCNFSGAALAGGRATVQGLRRANPGALVLLDAAALAGSGPLCLSDNWGADVDFAVVSFYKIFGMPTGVGALLVRRGSEGRLRKGYFGGGSQEVTLVDELRQVHRAGAPHLWLEDGTPPFLELKLLDHALAFTESLAPMARIHEHAMAVCDYALASLRSLSHPQNGRPAVVLYEPAAGTPRAGAVVAFNLVDPHGAAVGHAEVARLAALEGFTLRSGCFCNPGACRDHLGLGDDDAMEHHAAGHVCGDARDIILGRPTGALRVSFGWHSTAKDVDSLCSFLKKSFCDGASAVGAAAGAAPAPYARLARIFVFPVKGAAAQPCTEWPLGPWGLLHDREWSVLDSTGAVANQKTMPALCKLVPRLDLESGTLVLTVSGSSSCEPLSVPLRQSQGAAGQQPEHQRLVTVCGDNVGAEVYPDEPVQAWLRAALGQECTLIRKSAAADRAECRSLPGPSSLDAPPQVAFANRSQFLLITEASLADLNARLSEAVPEDRFRPNLVVSGTEAFAEDSWESISMQDGRVQLLSSGPCSRCTVINTDQATGELKREPLRTLASYRRVGREILFGRYFCINNSSSSSKGRLPILKVGTPIVPQ